MVGWVSGTAIRGKYWGTTEMVENSASSHALYFHTVNEVDKHILSDRPLAIPIPTQVRFLCRPLNTWPEENVPRPHAPPGEKWSGEQSQIPWAYYPNQVMTNEIARLVIIT